MAAGQSKEKLLADMTPALEARALVVGYDHPVAGPFDFTLQIGHRLGVFGPNGIGKSTLLRAILGSASVHSGSLIVHANPIASQPQTLVELRHMPWTPREQLQFLEARAEGVPGSLADIMDTRVDQLSGGQRQLLSVWSVLSGTARLVLLDEPTSYLDPQAVETLGTILQTLAPDKAIVTVSHDRGFLEKTCTELIEVKRRPAIGAEQ